MAASVGASGTSAGGAGSNPDNPTRSGVQGSLLLTKRKGHIMEVKILVLKLKYTGCCKTSGQLWKPVTDAFFEVFLMFLSSFDCQLWAIFHFGTPNA